MTDIHAALMIAVIALVTAGLRFLPFLIFRGKGSTPKLITYLGKVLPFAIIGMLVVYCLKDVSVIVPPFGLPELGAAVVVIAAQWKSRNSLVSILSGTAVYMILIRLI